MVTRYARSAGMTHAKERSTGVYAVGGKRPPGIRSCKYSPVFRRIDASHYRALASGRRFQSPPEPAHRQFPPTLKFLYLSRS